MIPLINAGPPEKKEAEWLSDLSVGHMGAYSSISGTACIDAFKRLKKIMSRSRVTGYSRRRNNGRRRYSVRNV